ncbi:MAG: hypothetical protein ABII90_16310, partial [Bacteroidota bacterium]
HLALSGRPVVGWHHQSFNIQYPSTLINHPTKQSSNQPSMQSCIHASMHPCIHASMQPSNQPSNIQ